MDSERHSAESAAATTHMRRFWDAKARENPMWFIHSNLSYSHPDDTEFWRSGEDNLDATLAPFGVAFSGTEDVLEVGCGIGRITRALGRRAASVTGVDVSAEMVEQGRAALADTANIDLIVGNGVDLTQFGPESFDAVYSFIVFQHIPDPRVTCHYVREIGRVLRPGGWTVFQVSEKPEIHRSETWDSLETVSLRIKRRLRRAPRGLGDPAWLGSAVPRPDLLRALDDGGLVLEHAVGDGTQFCLVH